MERLKQYFDAPQSPGRLYLLVRLILAAIALDVWAGMMSRAGRYGAADFNVAHFQWLDALQPVPTPGYYLGVMTIAAHAAFIGALVSPVRWLRIVAALCFTYGWAMSLLDSWQHHYFLSLVLTCLVGIPAFDARQVHADPSPRRARGFPLLCVTIAITYVWAGVAKIDPTWQSGATLKKIAGSKLDPLLDLWTSTGAQIEAFWALAGHSVVWVQLGLALVFLAAPLADRGARWARLLTWPGLFVAVSFHAGAELIGLEIGWFSYYMMVLALLCLLPGRWLTGLVGAMGLWASWIYVGLGRRLERAELTATLGSLCVVALVVLAVEVDLPGVGAVGVLTAVATAVFLFVRMLRQARGEVGRRTLTWALAAATSWSVMVLVVDVSQTRYDFYRFVGGDHRRRALRQDDPERRRELLDQSLRAYRKAQRYVMPGSQQAVTRKIEEIIDETSTAGAGSAGSPAAPRPIAAEPEHGEPQE